MNTKVKAGIAAAIVTALVALIILDKQTAPNSGPGGSSELNVGGEPTFNSKLRKSNNGVVVVFPKDTANSKRNDVDDVLRTGSEKSTPQLITRSAILVITFPQSRRSVSVAKQPINK